VIPPNTVTQDFWNSKMTYAFNVRVVGDDEGCILDIVADWQGANKDAGIWNASGVISSCALTGVSFWGVAKLEHLPSKRKRGRFALIQQKF
jgi:hypothetical protein